jgi:hypothetical protein
MTHPPIEHHGREIYIDTWKVEAHWHWSYQIDDGSPVFCEDTAAGNEAVAYEDARNDAIARLQGG